MVNLAGQGNSATTSTIPRPSAPTLLGFFLWKLTAICCASSIFDDTRQKSNLPLDKWLSSLYAAAEIRSELMAILSRLGPSTGLRFLWMWMLLTGHGFQVQTDHGAHHHHVPGICTGIHLWMISSPIRTMLQLPSPMDGRRPFADQHQEQPSPGKLFIET